MKQFLAISIVSILSVASYGQNTFQEQFDTFKNEVHQQYVIYNDSINKVFIKSIEENWIKFQTNHPIPVPKKPIPQMDVQIAPEESDSTLELEIDSIIRQKPHQKLPICGMCLFQAKKKDRKQWSHIMVRSYSSFIFPNTNIF